MSAPVQTIYDFEVMDIHNKKTTLSSYRGNVMLIVNTASKCGFTPQFEGLEKLYKNHKAQGFVVLGFPCNQFGAQEPLNESQIENFCRLDYGVTFPMFAKIEVNGNNAHPLYQYLKKNAPGILGSEGIKWNFTKFLIDRNGNVIHRYAPSTAPEAIEKDILKLLPTKGQR
ncbi:MAG TPA: glutathione peroxidase [Sulfuricurvum sp.]|nr:glutathione peroxidase [Sulfuricurvum sp.]